MGIITILVLLLPGPVFTCMNIWYLIQKKEETGRFEAVAFTLGILYSFLLYSGLSARPWEEAVWIYGDIFMFHEIISSVHAPSVLLFAAVGFLSYILLKCRKEEWPPLLQVLLISGLYVGILVNVLILIQMGRHIPPVELFMGEEVGDEFLVIGLLCLVPFNFLLRALELLIRIVHTQGEMREEKSYSASWLQKCNDLLRDSRKWALYAVLLLLPLLVVLILLLLLFGQQPDSVIRAFTETSDWTLSTKISPPPIEADAHYLCTVAMQGDEKLVKPLRYGIRKGERIVVNRQLCVANAFEQLLEERLPAFHRHLRHFYDTYGYPLSLHLQTPLRADVTYLLMKPLEWMFLLALYLFDVRPEDRIARQYLPGI